MELQQGGLHGESSIGYFGVLVQIVAAHLQKNTTSGAAVADVNADNIRPVPSCTDRNQCSECRWIPSCSESVPTPAY